MLLRQERDRRRCDHTCELRLCAALAQATDECGCDPWSAFARIHAENHTHRLSGRRELACQRHAHRVNGLRIQRRLTCDRTNPVCPKQLSHPALRWLKFSYDASGLPDTLGTGHPICKVWTAAMSSRRPSREHGPEAAVPSSVRLDGTRCSLAGAD